MIDSCQWSMGTTASAAPLPPLPSLHERGAVATATTAGIHAIQHQQSIHGNGMADGRQSLGGGSLQTLSIHNSKGKSIITNKVAPVVIT